MNVLLRRRWILVVRKYSKWRTAPYACLVLTIILAILQFTKYGHAHFLLVMSLVTLLAFERLAFTELLEEKDKEIETLKHHPFP
jgi:hypothetical protein